MHVVTIVRRYSCYTSTTLRQIHRTTTSSSSSSSYVVSFYPLRHSHLLVAFVSLSSSLCSSRVCMYGAFARHPSMDGTPLTINSVSSTNNTKASNKSSIIYPPLSTILLFRSFADSVPSVTFGATRGSLGWNYLLSVHPSSFAYDMEEDYSGGFKFYRVRDSLWMKTCVDSSKCVWLCYYGGPEWFQTFLSSMYRSLHGWNYCRSIQARFA